MAYLLISGDGWSQRWRVNPENEELVLQEIAQIGTDATSRISVVDPGSDTEATLMVAWAHVATAVVISGPTSAAEASDSAGQYA